ncbi:hypothetical protein L6164_015141 [Bauhinia variegata]|uniref:Uncharacterized protein n=1 Tax=Bauhinia variegata TaxID=167791 RepID=A0ACB9NKY0_BAUVA|nr:hypothetical protein L6164_015141 [Bauhinia variegata]
MASIPEGKAVNYNTAFIDTSLDTHLAVIVSDVDTVSDLKKRIETEHPLCFPSVGKIQIHAIKVKRRGYFYHLSDSMLASSAFSALNRSWFLRVDASALGDCGKIQHSPSPGSSNQLACFDIANNASNGAIDIPLSSPSKRFSNLDSFPFPPLQNWQNEKEGAFSGQYLSEHSGKEIVKMLGTVVKSSGHNDPEIPLAGTIPEMQDCCCVNCELPGSHIECELNNLGQGNKGELSACVEGICLPSAKGKRKSKRKKEDTVCDDAFKETNASVIGLGKDMVQQDIVAPKFPPEDAEREVSYGIRIGEKDSANGLRLNLSSNTCKRSSYQIQMSNESLKEMDAPKEQIEGNINKKYDVDIECNESLKEASEPGPSASKKHRKRKKSSLINDSKEDKLKLEGASLKSGEHKFDEACKESQEPKEVVEFDIDKSRNEIDLPCSKLCEEAPDTRSPAKKKRKVKERSENENSSMKKTSVVSDFDKETLKLENASQHSIKDQQKIEDNDADQSPGHFEDTYSLRSSALGGKNKMKKKSSNSHQTAMVSSCRNDDETERSRIEAEGAEEAISKGQISKDISTSKTAVDNTKTKLDARREGVQSKLKRTENSKKHSAIDMEVQASDVNKSKDLAEDRELSTYENIVINHCHNSEHGHIKQSEEKIEMSLQNDPDSMLLEKCQPPNQDHTDTNIKETTVTSKVLDVNAIAEARKSAKKKRKTRKAKDSGAAENCEPLLSKECTLSNNVDASEIETILVESHKSKIRDPTSRNTEKQDNLVNQVGRRNGLREEIKGNFSSVIDRETDDNNVNGAASSEHISKNQANAENEHSKRRKKAKKKQISAAKGLPDMLTEDQVPDRKEPLPFSDSRTLEKPSSQIADKTQALANAPEENYKQGPLEVNGIAKLSMQLSGDDNNHLEVPSNDKFDADRSIFGQQKHEAIVSDDMVSDKGNDTEKTDMELMTGKDKHKLGAIEIQTHAESSSPRQPQVMLSKDEVALDKMNGMERTDIELITGNNKPKLEATEGKTHGMLSKDMDDGLRIRSDKKIQKVHRPGPEAPSSSQSNSVTSTIEENRRPRVSKASGKIIQLEKKKDPFPASNSLLEGSKKMVQNKAGNTSRNNSGGVVGKTDKKKSLLAGEILKTDSSSSSEDEVDSNASTRTPSDNSFSSDYSDGESNANLSALQNGSYGGKRLENSGRSAIKARSLGTKGMSIDSILRSSSRFKKAKMTASQLEETESQPVDFVPESQANM